MSITGSVVILVVILARFLLNSVAKKYSYILWSIVGFRLCCPVSFKSVVSLFNINPFQEPNEIVTDSGRMNYIDAPINFQTPNTDAEIIGGADMPKSIAVENTFYDFIAYIWLIGLISLILYGLISYIKTRKQLSTATKKYDNIYQSENITTPFILGIIKPKIYIPYSLDGEYFEYVIAHEKYHLKRGDNFLKLIAFVLLCVHWFNPLCWLAFYLFNKDMEMSCDEWVLAHNNGIKKIYSNALLSFATENKFPMPIPLCFGEGSAKSRIKNILKYKKPAIIVSVIAVTLCATVAVICVANPKEPLTDGVLPPNNYIEQLYNDIEDNVKYANAELNEYKAVSPKEFEQLENDKYFSLLYVYEQFLQGNQSGIKANAMMIVMKDLIGGEQLKTTTNDPQQYFNEFLAHNVTLLKKNDLNYLQNNYPNGYALINSLDSRIKQICECISECSSTNINDGPPRNEEIAEHTDSKYVGDFASGVYSATFDCGNTMSFVITYSDKLNVQFFIGNESYKSVTITPSSSEYDFIYGSYWYTVLDESNVVCSRFNKEDDTVSQTVYTKDKSGNWSTETEQEWFEFDENNTIIFYNSKNEYSHAWFYINVEAEQIEQRDKNTGELINAQIPLQENSASAAEKAIALSKKTKQ